jgi:steroid Delta-isomerase
MREDMQQALERYAQFYETLTRDSLKELDRYFAKDARFKDPFNDVTGLDKIRLVFEDMFKTIGQPQFKVVDMGWSNAGDGSAFMLWTFKYRIRGRGLPVTVNGMSAMMFNTDGRIRSHIDYWDAAQGLYEHLPVIGAVLRWIRRRVEVK